MKVYLEQLENLTLEETLFSKAGINLRFRIHFHIVNGKLQLQPKFQVDEETKGPDNKIRRMIYADSPTSRVEAAIKIFNKKIEGI